MSTIKLPGLIDIHVHLRDMGQDQKEDFYSGTCAALAGGFTTVLDMPNNKVSITTNERLELKINEARKKTVCDIGFYFCSLGDNLEEFPKVNKKVFGLKLFLNMTTGGYILKKEQLKPIYENWWRKSPILFHSEGEVVNDVLDVVKKIKKRTHFCHISSRFELTQVIKAKEDGLPVTCGVTPHHLFLTQDDLKTLGPFGVVKPPLGEKKDKEFLWANLRYVDIFESDHAPHTIEEKKGEIPPSGLPGLETMLPLLLTAVSERRLTIEQIIKMCYENPIKLFKIPHDPNSKTIIDTSETYTIKNEDLKTKCGWSPFDGWKVKGKVKKVILRGKTVFENGKINVQPGTGKVLNS